jgi:hypothetical protein
MSTNTPAAQATIPDIANAVGKLLGKGWQVHIEPWRTGAHVMTGDLSYYLGVKDGLHLYVAGPDGSRDDLSDLMPTHGVDTIADAVAASVRRDHAFYKPDPAPTTDRPTSA